MSNVMLKVEWSLRVRGRCTYAYLSQHCVAYTDNYKGKDMPHTAMHTMLSIYYQYTHNKSFQTCTCIRNWLCLVSWCCCAGPCMMKYENPWDLRQYTLNTTTMKETISSIPSKCSNPGFNQVGQYVNVTGEPMVIMPLELSKVTGPTIVIHQLSHIHGHTV